METVVYAPRTFLGWKHTNELRRCQQSRRLNRSLGLARCRAIWAGMNLDRSINLSMKGALVCFASAVIFKSYGGPWESLPATVNGLNMHYRWADAARAGQWKHPANGANVSIDSDRIDRWVHAIKLARAKGVNLPVVKDHRETADNMVGEIFDARRKGNRLELLLGFKGDDALSVAQRNYLSIGIDPDFKDSHGNRYGEAIRHVAITPVPVIHGQRGFVSGG